MAKTSDSGGNADSWPGFLSELTKSFLILRDIFGYALPGAVFFATQAACGGYSLEDAQAVVGKYPLPVWLNMAMGIGACYAAGHLMSQIAYFFHNFWKLPWQEKGVGWRFPWVWSNGRFQHRAPAADNSAQAARMEDLIRIRSTHPELLTELERQSVMTQLRGSMGAATCAGAIVSLAFHPAGRSAAPLWWHLLLVAAGLFLLVTFWFSALPHVDDLQQRTIAAAQKVEDDEKAAQASASSGATKSGLRGMVQEVMDAVRKV